MSRLSSPSELPVVRLKTERRFNHPWIFQKMVERPARRLAQGSVVDIVDRAGEWVGRGMYNGHATIALRVLASERDEPIDEVFFAQRIGRAVALRKEALRLDHVSNAYRVVHAEGDGLSGLVIDRFGATLVVEFFAAGMYAMREAIRSALALHFPGTRTFLFADEYAEKQEAFVCPVAGSPPPETITEHSVKFRVAFGSKHKTGFFADQRDNRYWLASFCSGKRVLDLCCNTGGFAVYAATLGHAKEVVAVDLDEEAIAQAKVNAELNRARVRFVRADIFPWLREAIARGERYDVVVLDPAKMTRERDELPQALRKYLDMNRLALGVVAPGGVFLTCSCTGLVDEPTFLDTIRRASLQAAREAQVIRVAGAGADHPFLAQVPESRYLKAVFCRVN